VQCIYDKPQQMKDIQQHNKKRLQAVTSFLKWYRINNGLSQKELSEQSGMHRNTISRLESCNALNCDLLTILQVADAMNLDINQIFQEIK